MDSIESAVERKINDTEMILKRTFVTENKEAVEGFEHVKVSLNGEEEVTRFIGVNRCMATSQDVYIFYRDDEKDYSMIFLYNAKTKARNCLPREGLKGFREFQVGNRDFVGIQKMQDFSNSQVICTEVFDAETLGRFFVHKKRIINKNSMDLGIEEFIHKSLKRRLEQTEEEK